MKKHPLKLIATLALLFVESLSALIRPDPGHFLLEAEYLYLYPSFDDPYFLMSVSSPSLRNGSEEANLLGYCSAFSVGGMYGLWDPCQNLQLRWTYLHTTSTETITSRIFYLTDFPFTSVNINSNMIGTASSKLQLQYQTVEGLYENWFYRDGRQAISAIGGVRYSYIRFQEIIQARGFEGNGVTPVTPFSTNMTVEARMWGVGPEIGLLYTHDLYCIFPALSAFVATDLSLLVANSTAGFNGAYSGSTARYDVNDDETWHLVPVWDINLGVSGLFNLCQHPVSIELGYDIMCYIHPVSRLKFTTASPAGSSINNYTNLTLQGPFVRVSSIY